jgi:hypothetical protein
MTEQRGKALVYGTSRDLMAAVPTVLSRAGFDVTLVTTARQLRRCRNVDSYIEVGDRAALLAASAAEARRGYDLIVAGDDETLRRVRNSDLSAEEKLLLLPLTSLAGLQHIASKIGLSRVLAAAGIATPAFDVADDLEGLRAAIDRIGTPVVVKNDYGGGGRDVFFVREVAHLTPELIERLVFPVLVQRQLTAELLDCASFYREGRLVCLSCSTIVEATGGGIGPSVVRRYRTHPERDPVLIDTLTRLGRALHANGFANISALRTDDGVLHVFEADMRPNAWIDAPRLYGDDPAVAIARAFGHRVPANPPRLDQPDEMIVTNPLRMPVVDLVRNRYVSRSHYVSYYGRGLLIDRAERITREITSRRVVNWLRSLVGMPPAKRRKRND